MAERDQLTGDALAEKIIEEISLLTVTAGDLRDEKFVVLPWERDFIYGMCGHSISLLTVARGNGKTSLIAAIVTTAIMPDGALHRPRGKTVIVASSLDQAKECFYHVRYFLEDRMQKDREEGIKNAKRHEKKADPWRLIDNSHEGRIVHNPTGAEVRLIGSLPKKAHGKAPALVVCDEPAQWEGMDNGRKMYNAMKTSRGKERDAKLLVLGTRPEDEGHWYAELLKNPKTAYVQYHAAEKGDDDMGIGTIRKANPSYDYIPALRKAIGEDLEDARDGGDELNVFRAHRLNMGTPETSLLEKLISLENWRAICKTDAAPREGPVFCGVDLGGGVSMTAIAFYWAVTGRLEAYGAFPAEPSLTERGKEDGVGTQYVRMFKHGELVVYPGRATNNTQFLEDMLAKIDGHEIMGIAADRYKQKDLEQVVTALGLNIDIEWRAVGRGPEGGADVRAFQREVLDAFMSVQTPALALESAIAEAIIHRDANGNAALNKARYKGRIDVIQAAILAVGRGRRWRVPSETVGEFDIGDYLLTMDEAGLV